MRNKFSFYASYLEAIDTLPDDQQLQLYKAIAHYALQGEEPTNLTGIAKACFPLIKPNIDSDNRRYDANTRNGSMGGRPNETKTENNPRETHPEPKLETQKNPSITQNNPSITQNNPSESEIKPNRNPKKPKHNPPIDNGIRITDTEKENESFPPDNKKNNIFFLSDCAGVRAKEYPDNQRELYLTPAYEYHVGDEFGTAELEIVDTLLEIQEYAQIQGQIKHKAKTYTAEQINQILADKGKKLVAELVYKIAKDNTIKNKTLYILSSLLAGTSPVA